MSTFRRRRFLIAAADAIGLGALAIIGAARAQVPQKLHRIGILDYGSADSDYWKAFRQRLSELGYVEGRNLVIEARSASGRRDLLSSQAAELVKLKVELIAVRGMNAAVAARAATREIPIVTATGTDLIRAGLASSLARPGGNLTGVVSISEELAAKRLELLRIFVPHVSRVGILQDETNPYSQSIAQDTQKGAGLLGMTTVVRGVRNPAEYEAAFDGLRRERCDALVIVGSSALFTERARLSELALKHRLPTMMVAREYAQAGGLLSYGTDYPSLFRRAAEFADKILKGANPGELPIEQPTKFDLVVNLKTAKALGITIPQSLLVRADEVIR